MGQDLANISARWQEQGTQGWIHGISLSQASPLRHEFAALDQQTYDTCRQTAQAAMTPPNAADRTAYAASLSQAAYAVYSAWSDAEQALCIEVYRVAPDWS